MWASHDLILESCFLYNLNFYWRVLLRNDDDFSTTYSFLRITSTLNFETFEPLEKLEKKCTFNTHIPFLRFTNC